MKYLLRIGEKVEGPYDKAQIGAMMLGGKITKQTECFSLSEAEVGDESDDGVGDWRPLCTIPGLPDESRPRTASGIARPAAPDSAVRCPRCRSTQVTAIQKGFGTGGAVLGAVFLGPIGLLGGLIGSGTPKLACMKCGHTFQLGG